MLIKDSGAGGTLQDYPLEASLQKLGVHCYDTTDITNAKLAAVTISINRVKKGGGSVPIMYPMSLQAAMEISAANEGAYRATDGNNVVGTIDISNFGTLALGDDYLTISMSHTNSANFGVKFYSIEGGQYTDSCVIYEPNVCLADTPKEVNIEQNYAVALPVSNLTKVTFSYADGRTASYAGAELGMICADSNDLIGILVASTANVPYYGYINYYVIGCAQAVTMTVHYSSQTKFFLLKDTE